MALYLGWRRCERVSHGVWDMTMTKIRQQSWK